MMDRSFGSSSMIRDDPSNQIAATYSCTREEESGWTKYFEDFSNNNRADQEQTSFCSSLVSDASSGAACRVSHNNFVPKKLKKTRTEKVGDHDLEDTASSPVNSPKIGDFRPVDHMNPRKIDDPRINPNSLGEEHFAEMKQAGENSSDCPGKNGQNTDLKKKGLCLVPLNLIVNYLV